MNKLSEYLKGKTVKDIYPIYGTGKCDSTKSSDNYTIEIGDGDDESQGQTIIEFSDGSYITIWSSEWGGIAYHTKDK
jgi:hypothetical protein